MDIVERLKQEFSGTALKDVADQIQVYVKERHEAANEIERLREALRLMPKTITDAANEIERLRSRLEKPTPAMLEAGRAANRLVADNALGLACIAPDAAWAAMANLVLSEDK